MGNFTREQSPKKWPKHDAFILFRQRIVNFEGKTGQEDNLARRANSRAVTMRYMLRGI